MKVDPQALRALDLCALASLICLAAWYALGGYHALFAPFNNLWRVAPDALLEIITFGGDAIFALLSLLLLQRRPQLLWLGLLAALLTALASNGLKTLFDTLRPASVLPEGAFRLVEPLYVRRSFPSGHTITAFALAGVLACFTTPMVRRSLLAAAFVVGFSRVGVGAHWPIDVMGGAAVGCVCVRAAAQLAARTGWGLQVNVQRALVLSLSLFAIWSLSVPLAYPASAWVARPLAVAALLWTVWTQLIKPRVWQPS